MQPWATLVAIGAKTIETRSWTTAYRGPLLIHASLSKAGAWTADEPTFKRLIPSFNDLPFGAIVGRAVLIDVVRTESFNMPPGTLERASMEANAFGNVSFGRYAWLLEDAAPLRDPVAVKGTLGLWDFPDDMMSLLVFDSND